MTQINEHKTVISAYIPVFLLESIDSLGGKRERSAIIQRALSEYLYSHGGIEEKKVALLQKRAELEYKRSNLKHQLVSFTAEIERLTTKKAEIEENIKAITTQMEEINKEIEDLKNPEPQLLKEYDLPEYIQKPLLERLEKNKKESAYKFIQIYNSWINNRVKEAKTKGDKVTKNQIEKFITQFYKEVGD